LTGGYIRTNWRQSRSGVDSNAIGQGWQLGSFAGGAGSPFPNGGFIMGSINASTDGVAHGSTFFSIDTISAMNLFYGSDGGGLPLVGGASGFKILPINAYFVGSHATSASNGMAIWASVTANNSIIRFLIGASTVSAPTSANIQAHFVWEGFIVSTP
jgi:hypothetical protein